jgi:hypothetical protein
MNFMMACVHHRLRTGRMVRDVFAVVFAMAVAGDAGARNAARSVPNRNVLRGDRLVVDMTTGVSRIESDSGQVQGLFPQGEGCDSLIPGAAPSAAAPAPNKPK